MRFRHCLLAITLFLGGLLCPQPTLALPQFSTDYDVTYVVKETGVTHVIFNIAQKNNLSTVYATSFSLSVSQTNLENIKVSDSSGPLKPLVSKTANITNISFEFGGKIVGKDKISRFRLEYDTTDIATKTGDVWEVNIPKLESDENIASEQITLSVPDSFPTPSFIDPKPIRNDGKTFFFNSFSLGNRAITALFGSEQYYQVHLRYYLDNDSLQEVVKTIPLPPQTNYQQIFYQVLEPKPLNVITDADGNFLASYLLKPKSSLNISTQLIIKTNIKPTVANITPSADLLKTSPLWDYTNPIFDKPEFHLTSPKNIYDFVTTKLNYNFGKITGAIASPTRPGAAFALANPNLAICTEYSDLYVALARKNGIFAREHEGFALSTNDLLKPIALAKDVLHSWPAYYDNQTKTWLEVDPTWGYTTGGIDYFQKLDLNHLTFVIHGLSPTQPLPPGSFRDPSSPDKNIQVEPTTKVVFPESSFKLSLLRQDGDQLEIEVANLSGVVGVAQLTSKSNSQVSLSETTLTLPPFAKHTIVAKALNTPLFFPKKTQLIIELNGQSLDREITTDPRFGLPLVFLMVAGLGGFAFFTGYLYLRRRRG